MTIVVELNKKIEVSLAKAGVGTVPKLEVRLAMDESGSMQDEYREGLVDAFINRFIVAGMEFDDNQSLDVAFFSDRLRKAPSALAEDAGLKADGYLARKFSKREWGGTAYAPVVEHFETALKKGMFGIGGQKYRGYCALVTDGAPNDAREFEHAISKTSGDTYFEFIAIGNDITPTFLRGVAEKYKHTGFTHIQSPKTISDQEFYDALINPKFVSWLA